MRIASVAKAFSGAVALQLVRDGRLGLDDTIGAAPARACRPAWAAVTVRQMLGHTSGVPDYTRSDWLHHAGQDRIRVASSRRPGSSTGSERTRSTSPGSRYAYSNTDNIVIGLIAQAVTGRPYPDLLDDIVFGPARLRETSFPTRRIALPAPFLHGSAVAPGEDDLREVTHISEPEWRVGVGRGRLHARRPQRVHPRLPGTAVLRRGRSSASRCASSGAAGPARPGPGRNAAGLALFRYRTRCGKVYGHTGNFRRLRPVRGSDRGRPASGHDEPQHRRADRSGS